MIDNKELILTTLDIPTPEENTSSEIVSYENG
jgi:hypothetical protein